MVCSSVCVSPHVHSEREEHHSTSVLGLVGFFFFFHLLCRTRYGKKSATEVIVIVFPLGSSPEDWTAEFPVQSCSLFLIAVLLENGPLVWNAFVRKGWELLVLGVKQQQTPQTLQNPTYRKD